MRTLDSATLDRWRRLSVVDRGGATVGTISEFYLDRETGQPTWALVNTGLFGTKQTFVPLLQAIELRDGLQVPYEKGQIKDAPRIELDGELTPTEEAELFKHYGVDDGPATEPGRPDAGPVEPSPLERTKRRLERLVSNLAPPSEPGPAAPAERDAAARTRRERTGNGEVPPDR